MKRLARNDRAKSIPKKIKLDVNNNDVELERSVHPKITAHGHQCTQTITTLLTRKKCHYLFSYTETDVWPRPRMSYHNISILFYSDANLPSTCHSALFYTNAAQPKIFLRVKLFFLGKANFLNIYLDISCLTWPCLKISNNLISR